MAGVWRKSAESALTVDSASARDNSTRGMLSVSLTTSSLLKSGASSVRVRFSSAAFFLDKDIQSCFVPGMGPQPQLAANFVVVVVRRDTHAATNESAHHARGL